MSGSIYSTACDGIACSCQQKYRELYSLQWEKWVSEYQAFLEGVPDKEVFLKQMKALKRLVHIHVHIHEGNPVFVAST